MACSLSQGAQRTSWQGDSWRGLAHKIINSILSSDSLRYVQMYDTTAATATATQEMNKYFQDYVVVSPEEYSAQIDDKLNNSDVNFSAVHQKGEQALKASNRSHDHHLSKEDFYCYL